MVVYVVDTNVLRVWLNYYMDSTIPVFQSFWNKVNKLIEKGKIVFVQETYREIIVQVQTDEQIQWLENHKKYFLAATNEETKFIAEMFKNKKFQESVGIKTIKKNRKAADPFIIAKAHSYGENGIVITREKHKDNSAKIPTICNYYNIKCENDHKLIQYFFSQN